MRIKLGHILPPDVASEVALELGFFHIIPMEGEYFVRPLWTPIGDFRTDGFPSVGDCFVAAEGEDLKLSRWAGSRARAS